MFGSIAGGENRRFPMARSMLLVLGLVGLSLAGLSPAAPAPAPKPKPKGAEALFYVKRVPGKTEKEQAEIRQVIRYHLMNGLDQWILEPTTEIPGLKEKLKGPEVVGQLINWREQNVRVTWMEGTGVLRITCSAGTLREQAVFVNNAVKHCPFVYERQKELTKMGLIMFENLAESMRSTPDPHGARKDFLNQAAKYRDKLACLSEIIVLDLAEVPPR
jgi:hypothetical protein